MRGHLKKRSANSWIIWLELDRDPATGKRRQKTLTVRGTKKLAEAKLAELQHQMDTRTYIDPAKGTLGGHLSAWIQDHAWPNLSPKTAQNYEHMVNKHPIDLPVGSSHLTDPTLGLAVPGLALIDRNLA